MKSVVNLDYPEFWHVNLCAPCLHCCIQQVFILTIFPKGLFLCSLFEFFGGNVTSKPKKGKEVVQKEVNILSGEYILNGPWAKFVINSQQVWIFAWSCANWSFRDDLNHQNIEIHSRRWALWGPSCRGRTASCWCGSHRRECRGKSRWIWCASPVLSVRCCLPGTNLWLTLGSSMPHSESTGAELFSHQFQHCSTRDPQNRFHRFVVFFRGTLLWSLCLEIFQNTTVNW